MSIKSKKAEISIETFFLIFMSILMVGIILFGFQKIFLVEDHISEQDRIQIKKDLKDAIDSCEDPLSQGNINIVKIRHKDINGVCMIGNDASSNQFFLDNDELKLILETNNNSVVFMKTVFNSGDILPSDFQIIDFVPIDYNIASECFFDFNNTGKVDIKIKC